MIKINKNNKNYFEFRHSYRNKDHQLKHITKGIGNKIPSMEILDEKKDEFYNKIIEKRFKFEFNRMRNNYANSLGKYPEHLKKQELASFGIKFTCDSNKIEGSPINLRQTGLLIRDGYIYGFKRLNDVLETISHFKVFNILLDSKKEISQNLILNWHKALYKDTKYFAGKFRDVNIGIRGSEVKFPNHSNVKSLMKELIKWYNQKKQFYHPVLLAGLIKYKFVGLIHPFQDGNGRMSRLLMNYILFKNGYPMVNIEYLKRKSYYTALERSNLQENEMIFINWFLKYYIKNDYFGYYSH